MDVTAAAAELAALQADREAMAQRVVQPWWYDVLLGLVVFGFFGSYATHNWWVKGAAFLLLPLAVWGLATLYKRVTGVWLSGRRPGPTQRPLRIWLALCIGWAVANMIEDLLDVRGAILVASAVCGVSIAFLSRWWTRIYVAELRGEL